MLDFDATLVAAHSEKGSANPTWKMGFGFHPLLCFLDYTNEALAFDVADATSYLAQPGR